MSQVGNYCVCVYGQQLLEGHPRCDITPREGEGGGEREREREREKKKKKKLTGRRKMYLCVFAAYVQNGTCHHVC